MRKVSLCMAVMILVIVISISCSKGDPGGGGTPALDCSTVSNKSFSADVNPIIQAFCNQSGCHDVASVNGPGPITNYAQVFGARAAIRPAIASGLMPKNATLTTAQKNSFLCWIDSGAPNN